MAFQGEIALRTAGNDLREARRAQDKAMIRVYALVHEASAEGTPKSAIAEALGISRQTVYNILERGFET